MSGRDYPPGCPEIFPPVILIDSGYNNAFGFGGMHEFRFAQIDSHVAGLIGRLEKNQVTGLKLTSGYGFSLVYLSYCGAGQTDIKGIPIDGFDKAGAVDTLTAGAAESMTGAPPVVILIEDALLDIVSLRPIQRFCCPVRIGVIGNGLFPASRTR